MDQSLQYLHEVLSNYIEDNHAAYDIDQKMVAHNDQSEESFVRNLSQEDTQMLRQILEREIHHANKSGDHERGYQLNEINELLY
ncbi:sigma-G-dependent sporulation-specific acid-soluble spore protein CsgA [Aquibacillus sp. 3ASR75-11]|uniref:Sigma-G-dependent sporulation-specific acid-soluble spore protein CsgA n=1 Tax=Terrihalobacillus insolitus TaxID=2950438 RepID=A0A9X3WX86_9BACI|nr:sporulation protein [Terrihalobacillus insolitus]MDC3415009.1 sigma-G-dependent sporulation-specific acid-soluble spore protein CsgA [Terrihalobacillus insolitus]MDC3425856.1 sigma-G-dependent sporulation-specific acid-soluble spore protein CsgA [Terrihalobacillus insolitus]